MGGSLKTTNVVGNYVFPEIDVENVSINIANPFTTQIYTDGSTIYAVQADGTEIDSGSSFGTVFDSAVTNTLEGASIFIRDGDYDCTGTAPSTITKVLQIRGEGWYRDGSKVYHGTKIINTGGDTVDAPIINFSCSEKRGINISDLIIESEAPNSYGIVIDDSPYSRLINNVIDGNQGLYGGIKYMNKSYAMYAENNRVADFTDYGIRNISSGSANYLLHNKVYTSVNGAIGIEIQTSTIIEGGIATSIGLNGIGIQFHTSELNSNPNSSLVSGVQCEHTATFIKITGDTYTWTEVKLENLDGSLASIDKLVIFEQAKMCYLKEFNTSNAGDSGTYVAEFGADSEYCGVISSIRRAIDATYIVDVDAKRPCIILNMLLVDTHLSGMFTDSNLTTLVTSCEDHSYAPVWHDGTDWRYANSTTFVP